MSGLLIKTIDELTPIGDGLFNGTCLFAISFSAVTLNVTAAVLLGWIEDNIDLSRIAYDPTGDTIITATDLLAVIKELDAAVATGTNPFDQDLNTFNSPTFNALSVTANVDAQSFSGRGGLLTGTPAHSAAVDPGPGNDNVSGFVIGSLWHNTTDDSLWAAVDVTTASAVWNKVSSGASASFLTRTMTAGEILATGDICYLKSDGKMWKTDATTAATSQGLLGMASHPFAADQTGIFISRGDVAGYSGLTPGAIYYLSTTPGGMSTTLPTVAGEIVRFVAYALTSTIISFEPSKVWIEIVVP